LCNSVQLRAEPAVGSPHGSSQLLAGSSGSADLHSLDSNMTRGNGIELCQERVRWRLGKGSAPGGWYGTGTGCPGEWAWQQAAGDDLGNALRHKV